MNILYSASGVLTVFFMVLLLSKRHRSTADHILAGWFSLILLVIVTTYINYNQLEGWQGLFELTDSSVFLHGPLIWFYTLALTQEGFRFRSRDAWHVLPFLISAAYLLYPLLGGHTVTEVGRYIILITKMLHLLTYGIAVLLRLRQHERKIIDYFSYTEKIELNWLKLLVRSLIIIWTISAISQLVYAFSDLHIPQYGGFFTNLAVSVFMLVIGYFGIRQTTIFTSAHLVGRTGNPASKVKHQSAGNVPATKNRPVASGRNSDLAKKYQRLLQLMDREQPYLDGDLTLYKLAAQLQLPPHQLSQIINRQAGKSFFDFINGYRVAEFKRRILQQDQVHQTLLAIALDCGFNSKASFNRVFKKMTGLTPREFVRVQSRLLE